MTRTLKNYLTAFIICFSQFASFGQHSKADSLFTALKTAAPDTTKLNILNDLSAEYYQSNSFDSSLLYANSALQLCNIILEQAKDQQIKNAVYVDQAAAYTNLGLAYREQGNYPLALKNHQSGLQIKKTYIKENKSSIASSYNNIGNILYSQGNYPEALTNHLAALKLREESGDKKNTASSYNNIGLVYAVQGNYKEALKNYFSALKINEASGNKKWLSINYNNIGLIYSHQENYEEALKNYSASLKIKEELGDKKGLANSYINVGVVNFSKGNYDESLKNYFNAQKINEAIGHKPGYANAYINIAITYTKLRKFKEAGQYLSKGEAISREIGDKENLKNMYSALIELDTAKGNYKDAFKNYKLFVLYRDSLDNEETREKTVKSQMTFDFEMKEAVAEAEHKKELEHQQMLAGEKSRKQKLIIAFTLIGLFLLLLLSGFIFRSLRLTKKQKGIIELKNLQTEEQKMIIEEKNKDITDSINYAKRIQQAILPNLDDIRAVFPQSFILFKPKDIISGDFYFFHKAGHTAYIAAADCTGHGVPGAFMSVIGSEKLNEAAKESTDPSLILSQLNTGIRNTLKQSDSDESTRDGLDIALCVIDTANHVIKFAGAFRPLWIIRKGSPEVEEIKGTKKGIGGRTDHSAHFDTHTLKLQAGDTLYICTDGFADQFSGHNGKKLMTRKFKQILLEIQNKTMSEQEKYLEHFFENWRAETEQIDDVLVIGVRF